MVSLKLEMKKKDFTWLIPLAIVLFVGVVYAIDSVDPTIHGHPDAITPPGAVVAFDLASCPDGWTEFTSAEGKVIVGLDSGDASFDTRGEIGGEKTNTLTVDEMPSHRHYIGKGEMLIQVAGIGVKEM
ncbi:MAG: hypothetical protein ABIF18_03965, partial [archaeon]